MWTAILKALEAEITANPAVVQDLVSEFLTWLVTQLKTANAQNAANAVIASKTVGS